MYLCRLRLASDSSDSIVCVICLSRSRRSGSTVAYTLCTQNTSISSRIAIASSTDLRVGTRSVHMLLGLITTSPSTARRLSASRTGIGLTFISWARSLLLIVSP